jgi:hypothetical protein
LFQIFAFVLCDLLWFARNKAVHEGLIPDITTLASSIKKTTLDHAAAWQSTSSLVKEFWSPPLTGSFKVNYFDIAIQENFSVQAAVSRDSIGKIINALSQSDPPCDLNFGETLAARLKQPLCI